MTQRPLAIRDIILKNDRISVDVSFDIPEHAYTSRALVAQVQQIWPQILEHTCANAKGPYFSDVAYDTSVAHLLEHMIIDAQARTHKISDPSTKISFFGSTHWLDKDALLARVEVVYVYDVVVLKAISEAVEFLNNALECA